MGAKSKFGSIAFIFVAMSSLLLLYCDLASGKGLNNQTKQFTPSSKMSAADWSSASELHRTWQVPLSLG